MQKQLDEASKHGQEEIRSLSEKTTMLQREIDGSDRFPKAMVDWTTYEQYKDILELQTNIIALHDSLKETEKALRKVTLSLDCNDSLVKERTQQTREL